MNYNKQLQFFRRYRMSVLIFTLLVVALELGIYFFGERLAALMSTPLILGLQLRNLSWKDILLNSTLTIGLIFAISYLPKYLHLTIEPQKKLYWTLRIRWILAGALLLFGLPNLHNRDQGIKLAISMGILLGLNLIMRPLIKATNGEKAQSQARQIGTIYAVGDAIILYLLFQSFHPTLFFQVLIAAFVTHLAIQLQAWLPMVIFFVAIFLANDKEVSPPILLFLIFTGASYLFTNWMRALNEENRVETIQDLTLFTGKDQGEVDKLLLTSTGKLAANWHAQNPKTKAEVEQWYADNAPYYIYDLAQFHIAYKHIVFTLDIMALASGRVLDYGAGIGDLSLALAEKGMTVTYFDVPGQSRDYAQWNATRRNIKLDFASTHEEIADKVFDTIIVLDVLEHLFEPEQVLSFFIEHLAPGGLLMASCYFGATKSHPMHFDHKLDVATYFAKAGLVDEKSLYYKFFASEAMRRSPMMIYRKKGFSLGLAATTSLA